MDSLTRLRPATLLHKLPATPPKVCPWVNAWYNRVQASWAAWAGSPRVGGGESFELLGHAGSFGQEQGLQVQEGSWAPHTSTQALKGRPIATSDACQDEASKSASGPLLHTRMDTPSAHVSTGCHARKSRAPAPAERAGLKLVQLDGLLRLSAPRAPCLACAHAQVERQTRQRREAARGDLRSAAWLCCSK
jgi:hypothetical protein